MAAALLAYALGLGRVADRVLPGCRWVSVPPRRALQVWHLTAAAFIVAVAGAALLVAHDVLEHALLDLAWRSSFSAARRQTSEQKACGRPGPTTRVKGLRHMGRAQ